MHWEIIAADVSCLVFLFIFQLLRRVTAVSLQHQPEALARRVSPVYLCCIAHGRLLPAYADRVQVGEATVYYSSRQFYLYCNCQHGPPTVCLMFSRNEEGRLRATVSP